MKIALCGPSRSGKSCLRDGLKKVLLEFHRAGKVPYPYVLTACPDGEGAWFSETARKNPELAGRLKENNRSPFTPEYTERVAREIRETIEPLTFIDTGGKIDDKNRKILSGATHAIILSRDRDLTPQWELLCRELHLKILAILHGHRENDRLETREPILRGSIQRLERGEEASERPMVRELARLFVRLHARGEPVKSGPRYHPSGKHAREDRTGSPGVRW